MTRRTKLGMVLFGVAILLYAWPAFAAGHGTDQNICGFRSYDDGTVFTLTIQRSFLPMVTFKLCERQPPQNSFILVSGKQPDGKFADRQLPLTADNYTMLMKLYNDALGYNVWDASAGMDGAKWCLETQRGMNDFKACIWSPDYKTKERGFSGIVALGKKLWSMTNMQAGSGPLD